MCKAGPRPTSLRLLGLFGFSVPSRSEVGGFERCEPDRQADFAGGVRLGLDDGGFLSFELQ